LRRPLGTFLFFLCFGLPRLLKARAKGEAPWNLSEKAAP
jgi:hypothetical protein